MRQYITIKPRQAHIEDEPDAEDYLSRTVFESHELIDIGVMDNNGDPIMVRECMDQIGYVRFK